MTEITYIGLGCEECEEGIRREEHDKIWEELNVISEETNNKELSRKLLSWLDLNNPLGRELGEAKP